jgi:putative transposase
VAGKIPTLKGLRIELGAETPFSPARLWHFASMPQSLSAVYLHAVFSTKERWPYLSDPAFRAEVHSVLAGITNRLDCPPVEIGGMEDHVHVLARFGRTITQAEWIKEMKRPCTQWINDTGPGKCSFAWQAGYGIFSVSPSNVDAVQKYILEQEERHKKVTFQDEFRAHC